MSEESKAALTPELWARLRRHNDHASFACIILEGGYDAELGIDHGSSDFTADNARRATAARAVLNDALPDGDPGKITREDLKFVEDGYEDCHTPESRAFTERLAAKLAAFLPPEGADVEQLVHTRMRERLARHNLFDSPPEGQ